MRVIFIIRYDKESYSIDFLDAYWKLPKYEIGYEDLRRCTVSHISNNKASSAKVSFKDKSIAQEQLATILPHIYQMAFAIDQQGIIPYLLASADENENRYGEFLEQKMYSVSATPLNDYLKQQHEKLFIEKKSSNKKTNPQKR